jgi:hypothetical protein
VETGFLALFDTELHGDDAGGRDALYPVPEPSTLLLATAGLSLIASRRWLRPDGPRAPQGD